MHIGNAIAQVARQWHQMTRPRIHCIRLLRRIQPVFVPHTCGSGEADAMAAAVRPQLALRTSRLPWLPHPFDAPELGAPAAAAAAEADTRGFIYWLGTNAR